MIFNVQLVFDCVDPDAIMQFWGRALRYENDTVDLSLLGLIGRDPNWRPPDS